MYRRFRLTGLIAAFLLAALDIRAPAHAQAKDVVVFAAASLKEALDAANAHWQKVGGKHATISYAASSALAKQIEAGAPADVFISADRDWMDYLDTRKLIKPSTRSDLLGNTLALIAPANSKSDLKIVPGFDLAGALGNEKLAMADPNAVPAGLYGKAALTKLGVWDKVSGRVASAENVRATLLLVARGEAPFGIVYKTDAAVDQRVRIVGTFPADTHPPIVYPIAVTAGSTNPDAPALLAYLRSSAAHPAFEAQGFAILDKAK